MERPRIACVPGLSGATERVGELFILRLVTRVVVMWFLHPPATVLVIRFIAFGR
jgi:hypothetical protein